MSPDLTTPCQAAGEELQPAPLSLQARQQLWACCRLMPALRCKTWMQTTQMQTMTQTLPHLPQMDTQAAWPFLAATQPHRQADAPKSLLSAC